MTPTPCPKCGTMLDEDGYEGTYCTASHRQHHIDRCLSLVHAQLTAERAKVEEATKALDMAHVRFSNYFTAWGAEHDEPECPNDDTCTCPLVRGLNEAFAAVDAALEKLRGQ